MSLLLDARKKSQQPQSAHGGDDNRSSFELSLEDFPDGAAPPAHNAHEAQSVEHARSVGQNLFNAKSSASLHARASINRNLLIALGVTILLLAVGGGYMWYAVSPSSTQPVRYASPPAAPVTSAPATTETVQSTPVVSAGHAQPSPELPTRKSPARPRRPSPMQIEQHVAEPIDPVLSDAYRAYLNGDYDRAQQRYQQALRLDARNLDALLGLAATAQKRGADDTAAHYYARVLELDPRNAVANSGMAALSAGPNSESRLKLLLNEQHDSSALHFALGNRYAEQERWSEAQQSYFNAYKLDPNKPELAFNLAVSLDRLGQKQVAAQYYRRALELDSKNSAGFDHAQISQRIEELTH